MLTQTYFCSLQTLWSLFSFKGKMVCVQASQRQTEKERFRFKDACNSRYTVIQMSHVCNRVEISTEKDLFKSHLLSWQSYIWWSAYLICNVPKIPWYPRYLFLPSVTSTSSWMLVGLFVLNMAEFLAAGIAVAAGTTPVSSTSTLLSTLCLARQRTTAAEKQELIICKASAPWFWQNN